MIALGAIVLLLACLSILLVNALWKTKGDKRGGEGGTIKAVPFAGGTINRRMDLDAIKGALSLYPMFRMMRNTHDRPYAALPNKAMTAGGENVT